AAAAADDIAAVIGDRTVACARCVPKRRSAANGLRERTAIVNQGGTVCCRGVAKVHDCALSGALCGTGSGHSRGSRPCTVVKFNGSKAAGPINTNHEVLGGS